MKLNKKGSISVVLVIILSILLAASLGYTVYDKVIKEDNITEENKEPENDFTKEEEVKVVDVLNYKETYSNETEVTLPKIDSTKPNAIKLNEQILKDVLPNTYTPTILDEAYDIQWGKDGFVTKYYTKTKDDIIVIYIETRDRNNEGKPGSGDGIGRYNYFYNIKEDKILTIEEALPLLGYTVGEYDWSERDEIGDDQGWVYTDYYVFVNNTWEYICMSVW